MYKHMYNYYKYVATGLRNLEKDKVVNVYQNLAKQYFKQSINIFIHSCSNIVVSLRLS